MNLDVSKLAQMFLTQVSSSMDVRASLFGDSSGKNTLFADSLSKILSRKDSTFVEQPASHWAPGNIQNKPVVFDLIQSLQASSQELLPIAQSSSDPIRESEPTPVSRHSHRSEGAHESKGEVGPDKPQEDFVPMLKSFLRHLSQGDLDKFELRPGGLAALKTVLVKAGYDPDGVEDLLSSVEADLDAGKGISLKKLMQDLSTLEKSPDPIPEETLLPTSAQPILFSFLKGMGISDEVVKGIIERADRGNEGLSLDTLIQELETLNTKVEGLGGSFKANASDPIFRQLMGQLGLMPTSGDVPDDFVLPQGQLNGVSDALSPNGQSNGQARPSLEAALGGENLIDRIMAKLFSPPTGESPAMDIGASPDSSGENQGGVQPLVTPSTAPGEMISLGGIIASMKQWKKGVEDQGPSAPVDQVLPGENDTKSTPALKALDSLFQHIIVKGEDGTAPVESLQGQIKQYLNFEWQAGAPSLIRDGHVLPEGMGTAPSLDFKGMAALMELGKGEVGAMAGLGEKINALEKAIQGGVKAGESIEQQIAPEGSGEIRGRNFSLMEGLRSRPTAKNIPTYVTQQVSKGVVRAVKQGESSIRLQLKPPELGRLLMTIDNEGGRMKVSIMTESHAAKEILNSNAGELKALLSNTGIVLDKFDVDMSQDFRQSMVAAQNHSDQFNRRQRQRGQSKSGSRDPEDESGFTLPPESVSEDGTCHFVA